MIQCVGNINNGKLLFCIYFSSLLNIKSILDTGPVPKVCLTDCQQIILQSSAQLPASSSARLKTNCRQPNWTKLPCLSRALPSHPWRGPGGQLHATLPTGPLPAIRGRSVFVTDVGLEPCCALLASCGTGVEATVTGNLASIPARSRQ